MMFNICKAVVLFAIITTTAIIGIDAHPPQNAIESNPALDTMETEIDEMQNSYYESPLQQRQQQQQQYQYLYPSIPLDRLQMLIARYSRPTPYLRSPSFAGMNEVFRLPESKRQVKYRQCYFNPISCFKK